MILPGNRPFSLKPRSRPKGTALILHGFSAGPWEVLELGKFVQKFGWQAEGARIAGHGEGTAAFNKAGRAEWIASAEAAWRGLPKLKGPKVIIGHSGGGVLGTLLAAAHQPDVSGLILGAPAFRLAPWNSFLSLLPLARWIKPTLVFPGPNADSKYWTLTYASSRIAELLKLGMLGAKAAKALELPVLMMQAKWDPLVSRPRNERVFETIPSAKKELRIYDTEEHNVFHKYNPYQKQVFGWVETFLNRL